MRKSITAIILVFITMIFSAEFKIVSDIQELKGDLTAQIYGHKDINGEWCAVIKVFTGIKDLQFAGSGYEKHDYKFGTYLVYMQPGSKEITFIKEGFPSKSHSFPFKLQANTVYGINLKGIGESIEDISINILGEPEDVLVTLDGVELGNVTSAKTSVGKHELKISKMSYKTYIDTIDVTPQKTLFKYELGID